MREVAVWAGLEGTINRIGERFVSQCAKSKHFERVSDLEKFAGLGIERLRYPVLWEEVCPDSPTVFNWQIADRQLTELQRLGLKPIIGLLHHGSGPRYTNLIEPAFPEKFAAYAKAFAERFPWVEDYTPINEILTTSAFSCLYGHWYPHTKSDKDFISAVYNQVRATILAMREIQKINPNARLIQTEDLGRAQGTDKLRYQVEFQNLRRFLSFDMLCGKINDRHPLLPYLKKSGLTPAKIKWLKKNYRTPDILGINTYLLSNRYLDHRLEKYPQWSHGGNGRHRYADVGSVDVPEIQTPTPGSVCEEVWQRYQVPIAVTEVHVCGQREDQMRWLNQLKIEADELLKKNVDLRAITAWSLIGSYDWHRLCTVDEGFYESGVFDLSAPLQQPRETALAKMIRSYSAGQKFHHPILEEEGWWKSRKMISRETRSCVVIIGGKGALANAFARICEQRKICYKLIDRTQLDTAQAASVRNVLDEIRPWAVINADGYGKIDKAEFENEKCFRENVFGSVNLATWCETRKIPFVTFSSDLVFDGTLDVPYTESQKVSPLSYYGYSKAEGEKQVLQRYDGALIIRTGSFFGPWDETNFIATALKKLTRQQPIHVATNLISPTYLPDLVDQTLNLMIDGEKGILHLVNDGALSWSEFANLALNSARKDIKSACRDAQIFEANHATLNYQAKRPRNSALRSEKVRILPAIENAMHRYFSQLEVQI